MLLQVKSIKVQYGGVEALKGVSLEIADGQTVTLIGANGAGKTTLIKTISGIKIPLSGEIWFYDQRIDGLPPHEIAHFGVIQVPEGRKIFHTLSVRENLLLGSYTQIDQKKIESGLQKIFQLFPVLQERQNLKGGSLSGGEQQMLAVGRALMSNPRLLMMDEPTLGLSPLMCRRVGQIVEEIHQTGIGILLVEQNARMALKLASKGFVLQTGEIVRQGEAKDLAEDEYLKQSYLS
jgi:branched-chain amino acid transport system ATP-binding protein